METFAAALGSGIEENLQSSQLIQPGMHDMRACRVKFQHLVVFPENQSAIYRLQPIKMPAVMASRTTPPSESILEQSR